MKLSLVFEGMVSFLKEIPEFILQIKYLQFGWPCCFDFEESSLFLGKGNQRINNSQVNIRDYLIWDDWTDIETTRKKADKERRWWLSHFNELEIPDSCKGGINKFRVLHIVSDKNTCINKNLLKPFQSLSK